MQLAIMFYYSRYKSAFGSPNATPQPYKSAFGKRDDPQFLFISGSVGYTF
jgi:hypothetical protein